MSLARLALALTALAASSAFGEDTASGFFFPLSKGGRHLYTMNGAIGAGAASILLLGNLTGGPSRNLAIGGAQAVGLLTLFLGGGLTAGHLLEPTPPMAWSSIIAGACGAGVGLGLMATAFPSGSSFEAIMLAMAIGYVTAAGLDLALPGRDTMSWKEFWVPVVVAAVPGALLIGIGSSSGAFRSREFAILAMLYPAVSFLLARAILSVLQPFDPWVDDLKAPFRAEPIIAVTPAGAMVGLAANW